MGTEIRKFEFYASTGFSGCTRTEIVEIEIPLEASEEEVIDTVNAYHDCWLSDNIDTGWNEVEEDD